jgi:hypothetical protein
MTSLFDRSNYPVPIFYEWDQPSLYPKHPKEDRSAWAWEFTRRNPIYQRAWDIFKTLPDTDDDGRFTEKWKGNPRCSGRFGKDLYSWADPEPEIGETLDEFDARFSREHPHHVHMRDPDPVMTFCDFFEHRFFIHPHPCDWQESALPDGVFFTDSFNNSLPPWRFTNGWDLDRDIHRLEDAINEKIVKVGTTHELLGFDVALPIKPQLKRAESELRRLRKEWRENGGKTKTAPRLQSTESLRKCLQFLDGVAVGEDEAALKKKLSMQHEATTKAKSLRDRDGWILDLG